MDVERDFKTNAQHWAVIINYCELYPSMLKSNFTHYDRDSSDSKNRWTELVDQLNSLGYGRRSVEKWKLAIGRWRSKVKAKASNIKLQRERTGGGEAQSPPLSEIEERLMGLMGWKAITGDGNAELGVGTSQHSQHQQASSSSAPPPLIMFENKENLQNNVLQKEKRQPEGDSKKRKVEKASKEPVTKRKVPLSSNKTRTFVSMRQMHSENLEILKSIDVNIKKMTAAVTHMAKSYAKFMDFTMSNAPQGRANDETDSDD